MEKKVILTAKQLQAFQLLTDNDNGVSEILYGGAARGGKTWLGCLWQITQRLLYPMSAGMIVRKTYTDLHGTTLRTFRKVAAFLEIADTLVYRWGAENLVEFPNGSVIFFRYAKVEPKDPEFNRFGSYDLTDLFADESQEIDAGFFNVIRGRFSLLSGERADGTPWHTKPKMLLTCNPSKGYIYKEFWKPFREGKLPKWRAFVRALGTDNPYIDPAYFETLLKSDKVTIQRLYYGNFDYDDDPNALFEDYDALCDMFTNAVEFGDSEEMAAGAADVALKGRDRFALVTSKNGVYTFRLVMDYSKATDVQAMVEREIKVNKIPRSRFMVDADGVGNFVSDYVRGIKEFHGGARADEPARYANLKAQYYYELARLVRERKIRVEGLTDSLRELLTEELQAVRILSIDSDTRKLAINSKEEQKKLLGRSPDLADALMMCVCANKQKAIRAAVATTIELNNGIEED